LYTHWVHPFALSSLLAGSLPAQERPTWSVAAGIGLVRQERRGNIHQPTGGMVFQAHVARHLAGALNGTLEFTRSSVRGDEEITLSPCEPGFSSCHSTFVGPVAVIGLTTGLQATSEGRRTLVSGSLGPGVYWLDKRPPNTRSVAPGLRVGAGVGYRFIGNVWLVSDLCYHRLFTDGESPRWLVGAVLGLAVR
jgi:hypothetical protein